MQALVGDDRREQPRELLVVLLEAGVERILARLLGLVKLRLDGIG